MTEEQAEISRLTAEIARLKNSTTQARYVELEQARNHYYQQLAATRAERDALAALVDEAIERDDNSSLWNYRGLSAWFSGWVSRAKALRAPQTGGAE